MLKREDIAMETSALGFVLFAFFYPLVMQPVSVWGYASEFIGRTKKWG